MATPRRELIDLEVTNVYHCIARCVRRAFLCGEDRYTGKNYEHRKEWIRDRLRALTEFFAIDVCAYAVMSNHLHVALRIDEERAALWTADEVARRYIGLYPSCKETWDLNLSKRKRAELVKQWRERLSSISWMMRGLSEFIAKRANREDGVRGRFWEGRFKSQPICDEQGFLTCMAYVDLNPVRAGIVDTLEGSDFTSIQERLRERSKQKSQKKARRAPRALAPMTGEKSGGQAVHSLPISLEDYRKLLVTTGSVLLKGKVGKLGRGDCSHVVAGRRAHRTLRVREPSAMRYVGYRRNDESLISRRCSSMHAKETQSAIKDSVAECREFLASVGISWQGWLSAISGEQLLRAGALGNVESLSQLCQRRKRKWVRGIRVARQLTTTC